MSQFIANARIAVYADTTAFSAALKKILTTAERTRVVVKLVPDPKGFIRDATVQIKSIEKKLPPVKVKVVPNTVGFATAVRLATADAVKNITIPVGVVPGQVAATGGGAAGRATGGVAAGGVVDRRAAQAQLAIAAATDAGVAARRRFDKAISDSSKQMLLDQRIATQLATATDAVTAATKSGIPALLAEAEALQLTAVRAQQANVARKARAAAPAAKQAAAEAANAAAIKKTLDLERQRASVGAASQTAFTTSSAARAAALKTELDALIKIDKKNDDRIAKERAATADARSRASQLARSTRTRGLNVIGDQAIKQNEALATSADAASRAETQFAAARRHTAVAAIAENDLAKKLAATKAAERATTAGLVEAEIALSEARAAAAGSTSAELRRIEALRVQQFNLAKARVSDAAAATAQAKAQLAASGRFAAGRRALEAFGATLAGLRGAALSAEGAFLAVGAAAIAITKAVQQAAQLESTLNVFRVTAGATADEMSRVSATSRELGRDVSLPGVSALDAADALTLLSKAGLDVQNSIDSARGVLQLATAAGIENAQATELTANALNAFGLAGNQAVRVADVLANAANASQGSIVDMGVALQQSSAVARQAGLTLEQTVAALTLFARSGLRGSDAGTSFRTALIRLINPTAKAQKEIDKLGLNLRTATGAINLNVFDEFAQKTRDLTAAQRDQTLAIIFGQDAIRGAAILAREGKAGLDTQIEGLKRQGTAAEQANARMAGLAGSLENLKNQLSSVGITIGQVLIPPLKVFTDAVSAQIGLVNDLATSFLQLQIAIKKAAKEAAKFALPDLPQVKIGPVDTEKQGKDIKKNLIKAASFPITNLLAPGAIQIKLITGLVSSLTKLKGSSEDVGVEVRNILAGLKNSKETVDGIAFTAVVGQLEELQNRLAGGDKEAQRLSSEVADIIAQLKEGQTLPPFKFPKVQLPPDLRAGRPGKEAGDSIFKAFNAAIPGEKLYAIGFNAMGNFERGIRAGAVAAAATITSAVPQIMAAAEAAIIEGTARLTKRADITAGALQEKALDIELAGGGDEARLRNLRRQFKVQQDKITALEGQTSKAAIDARRQAKTEQVRIQGEIEGIEEARKNAAEGQANKIKKARDDADQAVLDSFAPARSRLSDRAARASATSRVEDDIAVQKALIAQIKRERDTISNTVKNVKTRMSEMRARTSELNQAVLDLKEIRKRRDEAIISAIEQQFAPRIAFAEATGNTSLLLRLLDQEIARINKEIRLAKKAKRSTQVLETALAGLQETRNQAQDELLAALRERAELRLEVGGGSRNAVINAINKQIAQKEKERRAVKKFGLKWVQLGNEILQLQIDRREALGAAKDTQGLTVFELLKQNVETFNAVGGNLIQGNQPFPGPTGFTADVAQWLVAQKSRPTTNLTPSAAGKTKIEINDDRLVRAIERWTDAVERRSGNAPAGAPQVSVEGQRWNAIGEFWQSRRTKMAIEADPTA